MVSTRRLVDTLDEQALLEEIVDDVKPLRPAGVDFAGLHYLLFTPFRYPPLSHGSRFGSATERSLWYGAERIETSLAEKAYYRLLFVAGTKADLKNLSCDWSAFQAEISADRGVDLTTQKFAEFQAEISSPSSYAAARQLGARMRGAGVQAFLYTSSRCPQRGRAIGLFEPAFSSAKPKPTFQTWRCGVTTNGCEVVRLNSRSSKVLVFERAIFEVDGVLPAPAV
jgi:RES domain